MKKLLTLSLVLPIVFALGCEKKPTPVDVTVDEDPTTITDTTMQLEPKKGDTVAIMETNFGDISILLYTKKAPETTKNFIELTKQGKYEDVPFHRIIPNFMIQGGDFENKNGTGGYTYNGPGTLLKDETVPGLEHVYGAVSMAKTPLPDSAGSQFFIVQAKEGTHHLDGVHSVFGYAYDGMDVVEKMAALETDGMDRPAKRVLIEGIEIEKY
jgi:peptidyl-prolyl cis-trans isomerase B (cyclophilin B)